jgi:hypothetical protein
MAASATFVLKAGEWFRRGRLLIVSPDSLGTACPLSGRNSTFVLFRFLRPALSEVNRHRRPVPAITSSRRAVVTSGSRLWSSVDRSRSSIQRSAHLTIIRRHKRWVQNAAYDCSPTNCPVFKRYWQRFDRSMGNSPRGAYPIDADTNWALVC